MQNAAAPVSVAQPQVVEQAPAAAVVEDDDDLPRPGKVWDNSGPSLSELLKQQQRTAQAAAPAPAAATSAYSTSNIQAVNENDLPAVWQALLHVLRDRVGVHPLLVNGELVGIRDGQAIIRYTANNDQFPKMLSRNGKKELVGDAFSQVLGRAIGVRFEVMEGSAPATAAGSNVNSNGNGHAHTPAPAAPAPPVARRALVETAEAAPVMPAGSAQSNAGRPTAEQVAELEKDPLVGALMKQLGATIVKIAEEP